MRRSYTLVGPDGTGKTTLADALEARLVEQGVTVTRAHYRPGILGHAPPAAPGDGPHEARPAHGRVRSCLKLIAVAADYLLAWIGPWRRASRSGALILERGWYDQVVDPGRYRLSPRVVGFARVLGRLLPQCAVAILLVGDAEILAERKRELSAAATRTQLAAWAKLADRAGDRVVTIDTVNCSVEQSVDCALHGGTSSSEWRRIQPAPSRLGLRAAGGRKALPALVIYEPSRRRAKVARRVAETSLRLGLGRHVSPPVDLEFPPLGNGRADVGVVAMKSSYPGRWIVGVARAGHLENVIKVSSTRDENLENEAEMLRLLEGRALDFAVPHLAFSRSLEASTEVGMVAAELGDPVTSLEVASAVALELSRGVPGIGPMVHGDLAPWNLREGRSKMWLIDWEAARVGYEPLHDLSHFVVRSGTLLAAWTPAQALRYLVAEDSIGWKHLCALDEDPRRACELLLAYLASEDDVSTYANELRTLLR